MIIILRNLLGFVLPGYNLRPLEMSGAIGIEQLKKLPKFLYQRRKNAEIFQELFDNHPYLEVQTEIGESSWFGFSLLVKEHAPFDRKDLIDVFEKNDIEFRPIVSGKFFKNRDVLKYFDYEIYGSMEAAEFIETNGLSIGNHQMDISDQIKMFSEIIPKNA